jgi:hypothetical protein
MKIRILFFFTISCFVAGAQQQITLQNQQTVIVGNGILYDNGGPNAPILNTAFTTTIQSATPFMRMKF